MKKLKFLIVTLCVGILILPTTTKAVTLKEYDDKTLSKSSFPQSGEI